MGERPKICHVLTSLEVGGMERMVCTLMETQATTGPASSVFCTDSTGKFFDSVTASARMCAHRQPRLFLLDLAVVRKLIAFARAEDITLLHAHNPVGQLYSLVAALRLRIPVVVTYHGQAFNETRKIRLLRKVLCYFTQATVAISEDVKQRLLECRIAPAKRLHAVRNGISSRCIGETNAADVRRSAGIAENACVVGSVGRLALEKDYSLLLNAFAWMRENAADGGENSSKHVLILVGGGPQQEQLETQASELNISQHVLFVGESLDVDRWLGILDVFCLSSLSEGTSIALLEACAYGLPAVVTDAGGNSEVVKHDVSGIVTAISDEKEFGESLLRICADADLRRRMGDAARAHVLQDYSAEVMAAGYAQIYSQV